MFHSGDLIGELLLIYHKSQFYTGRSEPQIVWFRAFLPEKRRKMMPKHTHDYDNVFKTMKMKHKRLFIPVINDAFQKHYSPDEEMEVLPSEGYFTDRETKDGSKEIEEDISDFLLRIGSEVYLIECQSYPDGSIAIRIAEYAFLVARQFAIWDNGNVMIPMPHFAVVYVKATDQTPPKTSITFTFPDGQAVCYESDNILLRDFTKEELIEKRLFPYIPYYVVRYERDIIEGKIDTLIEDLVYLRDAMIHLYENGEFTYQEMIDLTGFVNTIIKHITDGNESEERLVNIMGGTVIETESERLMRIAKDEGIEQGIAQETVIFAKELGWTDEQIVGRLRERLCITPEQAVEYLENVLEQFKK